MYEGLICYRNVGTKPDNGVALDSPCHFPAASIVALNNSGHIYSYIQAK